MARSGLEPLSWIIASFRRYAAKGAFEGAFVWVGVVEEEVGVVGVAVAEAVVVVDFGPGPRPVRTASRANGESNRPLLADSRDMLGAGRPARAGHQPPAPFDL